MNGTFPLASLILSGNTLYGTTQNYGGGPWSAAGGQYSVTNPIADKQRFFRLVHP